MEVRVYVKRGGRDCLHVEMATRSMDVESVAPHMIFADKGGSKSNPPLPAGVVCDPIIRVYISADDWGRLRKDNVLSWDIAGQVSKNPIL